MYCFQLNDEPHIADALVTKGVAYGGAVPEQIKVRHICIVYTFNNVQLLVQSLAINCNVILR